jgi:hypothetical protein
LGFSKLSLIALVLNNRRSLLLEDADYDGHSLLMLQKNAVALNQKVEIKFSAIATFIRPYGLCPTTSMRIPQNLNFSFFLDIHHGSTTSQTHLWLLLLRYGAV